MTKPALTSAPFEAAFARPKSFGQEGRIIWTLPAIGRRIGVGPDFVRDTLAKLPDTPVKEIGGRYYAFEHDLIEYLRSKR